MSIAEQFTFSNFRAVTSTARKTAASCWAPPTPTRPPSGNTKNENSEKREKRREKNQNESFSDSLKIFLKFYLQPDGVRSCPFS